MLRKTGWLGAGLTVAAISTAASFLVGVSPAQAVVYCKTVGVPKGCVVRPTPVVVAPVVAAPVAAAVATPGVGAPGVGVAGTPMNRGGPVDRVGRR